MEAPDPLHRCERRRRAQDRGRCRRPIQCRSLCLTVSASPSAAIRSPWSAIREPLDLLAGMLLLSSAMRGRMWHIAWMPDAARSKSKKRSTRSEVCLAASCSAGARAAPQASRSRSACFHPRRCPHRDGEARPRAGRPRAAAPSRRRCACRPTAENNSRRSGPRLGTCPEPPRGRRPATCDLAAIASGRRHRPPACLCNSESISDFMSLLGQTGPRPCARTTIVQRGHPRRC